MAWRIEFADTARKDLAKLDKQAQARILRFLRERVAPSQHPTDFAAPLKRDLSGLWKIRVGDYRLIVEIVDEQVLVLVLKVGHRRRVYGGH
ncbi:MAG: type II toxin-antitoxin system RelE/ParE family toxin [Desulfovibrionaceae bacterium]